MEAFLFRYLKKQKFELEPTVQALLNHLEWRIQNDLAHLNVATLSPQALGLFDKGFTQILNGADYLERPILFIRLGQLSGANLESIRSHLMFVIEMGRKLLFSLNNEQRVELDAGKPKLLNGSSSDIPPSTPRIFQLAVMLDLAGFGFSQFVGFCTFSLDQNYEFLPTLHDLFSKQYPQGLGVIYVLNYGWVHAGIWNIVKPMLSQEACERLLFLGKEQLKMHIPIESIPKGRVMRAFFNAAEYGGLLHVPQSLASNHILSLLASPEYSLSHPDIPYIYSRLVFPDAGQEESEDDVWYEAQDTVEIKVTSALDLQHLLRSSPNIRNVAMSRKARSAGSLSTLSRSGTLRQARTLSSRTGSIFLNHRRTPSPDKRLRNPPRIVKTIINEMAKSPNPGVGLANGLAISFFGWSSSLISRLRFNYWGYFHGHSESPKAMSNAERTKSFRHLRRGVLLSLLVILTWVIVKNRRSFFAKRLQNLKT